MAANVPIIGGHHVLALQSPPEGWQATSLLERCRKHPRRRRAYGAAARAVSGRDQRFAGIGLTAVDRSWRRAAADTVAVSGRPCRGAPDGCFGRRRQTVGIASGARPCLHPINLLFEEADPKDPPLRARLSGFPCNRGNAGSVSHLKRQGYGTRKPVIYRCAVPLPAQYEPPFPGEQFHARTVANNATRLSGIEWLWLAKRA
jgi:hypothetical protein